MSNAYRIIIWMVVTGVVSGLMRHFFEHGQYAWPIAYFTGIGAGFWNAYFIDFNKD